MYVSGEHLRAYFEGNAGAINEDACFIGRMVNSELAGVVAVWNFTGQDAEVGWAGEPGWLTRGLLRLVFEYLFDQLGLARVTGRIDADNATARQQTERLGFVHEGTLRGAGTDGQDVLIYGLLRTERRW